MLEEEQEEDNKGQKNRRRTKRNRRRTTKGRTRVLIHTLSLFSHSLTLSLSSLSYSHGQQIIMICNEPHMMHRLIHLNSTSHMRSRLS
jgi:hypothetical protein